MKFACRCGHVIADQTDDLPYKAELVADQDWERTWGALIESFTQLAAAAREGREAEWARSTGVLTEQDLRNVIADFVVAVRARAARTVYQCEACKRLWVQLSRPDAARYASFAPEDGTVGLVLGTDATELREQK